MRLICSRGVESACRGAAWAWPRCLCAARGMVGRGARHWGGVLAGSLPHYLPSYLA